MRERKKQEERAPEDRRSPEGVRIIRADEAQAAMDTGQAAGRRPEGELRFGDVPPAPEGPRPPHRFPLPDTVDPAAAVPRRPLAAPRRTPTDRPVGRRTARIDPDAAHDPRPWDERVPVPPASSEAPDVEDADGAELADPHAAVDATAIAAAGAGSEATETWPSTEYGGDEAHDQVTAEHEAHDPAADYSGYDPHAAYQQPVWDPQSGYQPPTYEPQGGYQQHPGYQQPVWDPQSEYEQQPGYEPQPGYQQHPGYEQQPGYEPHPGDQQQAGYEQHPGYEPQAGYQEQPVWDPQSGYSQPGYDPDPSGSVTPGPEGAHSPGWEPSAAWREWQEPAGAPRSEWPPTSSGGPTEGSDLWPVAEDDFAGFEAPEAAGAEDPTEIVGPADHRGHDQPALSPHLEPGPGPSAWVATSAPHDEGEQPMPASQGDPAGSGGPPDEHEVSEPPSLGLSVARGSTEMPHWTDPPTGEVPRVLSDASEPEGDDLKAWRALGSSATRWRGDGDWDEDVDLGDLGSDESRVGAMDTSLSEQSDLYSFDKEFDALEEERSGAHAAVMADDLEDLDEIDDLEGAPVAPEPVSVGSGPAPRQDPARTTRATRSPSSRNVGGGGGTGSGSGPAAGGQRDLGQAIAVGIGLIVLLLIAYAVGSAALLVLATAVVVACAVEGYGMLQRAGFRPATLLGLVATAGVMFAAYWRGEAALPLVSAVMLVATMVWYLLGRSSRPDRSPMWP